MWQAKVHERVYELCRQSWQQNGKRKGYSVPVEAELLIEALNSNDEETCKAILLYGIPGNSLVINRRNRNDYHPSY
jgi:hypothetical protein